MSPLHRGIFRDGAVFVLGLLGDGLALSVIAARCQLPRQRHALSVTFGDTSFAAALPSQALRASSPKGGATGVPGHFPLDA